MRSTSCSPATHLNMSASRFLGLICHDSLLHIPPVGTHDSSRSSSQVVYRCLRRRLRRPVLTTVIMNNTTATSTYFIYNRSKREAYSNLFSDGCCSVCIAASYVD
jgi:hypothetical protein